VPVFLAADDAALRQAYDAGDWFTLRDAVRSGTEPLFYRPAVAAAFHDPEQAQQQLESVIHSAPKSTDEAHELLVYLHWRRGPSSLRKSLRSGVRPGSHRLLLDSFTGTGQDQWR
jgi:hypothetical protein